MDWTRQSGANRARSFLVRHRGSAGLAVSVGCLSLLPATVGADLWPIWPWRSCDKYVVRKPQRAPRVLYWKKGLEESQLTSAGFLERQARSTDVDGVAIPRPR